MKRLICWLWYRGHLWGPIQEFSSNHWYEQFRICERCEKYERFLGENPEVKS
jgi:hypothetical protein